MEDDDEDAKKTTSISITISSSNINFNIYKHNMSKTWYMVYTEQASLKYHHKMKQYQHDFKLAKLYWRKWGNQYSIEI